MRYRRDGVLWMSAGPGPRAARRRRRRGDEGLRRSQLCGCDAGSINARRRQHDHTQAGGLGRARRPAACARSACRKASAQAPRKGGDVVIAISQAPPSLDAHVTSAQAARNVKLHIYETLYARDENAKPVPELAEGVNIGADGKTYVFPIRKGVKFHNGKELDAKDVVASLERYRKVGASPALLSAIEKVEASGPSEVTIKLKEVQSTFLDNLSSPRAPIAIYPARRPPRTPARSTSSAPGRSGSSSTSPTAT